MVHILNTLLPVFFLIGLGYLLAARGFLSESFLKELNRLIFWVALPALIIKSLASASAIPDGTGTVFLLFMAATFIVAGLSFLAFRQLGLRRDQMGTFVQACFRGNLAYSGIPIILFAMRGSEPALVDNALAQTIFVFAPTMLVYNILAVVVLQFSHHSIDGSGLRESFLKILRNPLILSSLLGMLLYLLPLRLPRFLLDSLDLVGQMAAPAALLCVGGSMAFVSMEGRYRSATVASLLKVGVLPLISLVLARLFGLDGTGALILLVLSACPTAVASYVMAEQMKGDTALAAGSIVISTVLCIPALALVIGLS